MTARSNWAFASPCSAALRTPDKVAASDTFFHSTAFRLWNHQAIEAPDTATMHTRGTLILANDVIAPTEAWRSPKKECYHLKWYLQSRGVVAPRCYGDFNLACVTSWHTDILDGECKNLWLERIIRKRPTLKKSKGENGSSPWTTSWRRAALNG